MNYYNENDEFAARWLRNLIAAGEIPNGHVDSRDIRDVRAGDLRGYTQCHFFAGIGGWPLALRLAEWPADRPVWTGSCPCQPFSNAGRRLGEADERHLWPVFGELIDDAQATIVFGEQVASRDGREWLSRVRLDLEGMGLAVGAADLCAASVGAPHIRQRLYFGAIRMGRADDDGREAWDRAAPAVGFGRPAHATSGARGARLADANGLRFQRPGESGTVASAASAVEGEGHQREWGGSAVRGSRAGGCGMADANNAGLARPARFSRNPVPQLAPAQRNSVWSDAEWLDCRDGKTRRVKPGVPLLVDGLPREVAGSLAGFGNAIVPELAAQFVRAFNDAVHSLSAL